MIRMIRMIRISQLWFSPRELFFCAPSFFQSLDCRSFLGGGGNCRRQGKSAAPTGRRGERLGRDSIDALFSCEIQSKTRQKRQGADRDHIPSPPAPGPLLRDMSTKMGGPGVCEEMRTALWFSTSFKPPFISSCFAYNITSFPPWIHGFCCL